MFWLNGGRIVSIDDAYVRAAKLAVSTDVSGIVEQVAVHEGQRVNTGDVLFRLDPRQFQIALDGAKANLAQIALTLDAMKRDYLRMLRDIGRQAGAGGGRPGELRPLRQPREGRRRDPRRIRRRAVQARRRPAPPSKA